MLFRMALCVSWLLWISCTDQDALFHENDSSRIIAILYVYDPEGNVLDSTPQSKPWQASYTDTLKIGAELFKLDSSGVPSKLGSNLTKEGLTLTWNHTEALNRLQITHFPDSMDVLNRYTLSITDSRGDALQKSIEIEVSGD